MQEGERLTVKERAQLVGVSERAIYNFGKIKREAPAWVVEAVEAGEMSMNRALTFCKGKRRETLTTTLLAYLCEEVRAAAETEGITVSEWLGTAAIIRLMVHKMELREGDNERAQMEAEAGAGDEGRGAAGRGL